MNYTWKLDTSLGQFHITRAGLDDPEALLCIALPEISRSKHVRPFHCRGCTNPGRVVAFRCTA